MLQVHQSIKYFYPDNHAEQSVFLFLEVCVVGLPGIDVRLCAVLLPTQRLCHLNRVNLRTWWT